MSDTSNCPLLSVAAISLVVTSFKTEKHNFKTPSSALLEFPGTTAAAWMPRLESFHYLAGIGRGGSRGLEMVRSCESGEGRFLWILGKQTL